MLEPGESPNTGSPRQPLSADKVAALIDGRVSGAERDELVEQLRKSDDDLSIVADATGAVADLEASGILPGDKGTTVTSPFAGKNHRRSNRLLYVGGLAAAAVATFLVIRPSNKSESYDAASDFVEALSSKSALGADWNYTPWGANRGDIPVQDQTAYIRIGARATDLELAIQSSSPGIAQRSQDIEALLENVPGGAASAAVFHSIAENPRSSELQSRGRTALAALPLQGRLAFGSWIEAARIAASRRDAQWFERDDNRSVLSSLIQSEKISPADRETAGEILTKSYKWNDIYDMFSRILGTS